MSTESPAATRSVRFYLFLTLSASSLNASQKKMKSSLALLLHTMAWVRARRERSSLLGHTVSRPEYMVEMTKIPVPTFSVQETSETTMLNEDLHSAEGESAVSAVAPLFK